MICAAACWAAPASAKAYRLEPSSPWNMDYDRDACSLARSFGSGEDQVLVQFLRFQPGAPFELRLAGKPLGRIAAELRPTPSVRFGEVGEPVRTPSQTATVARFPMIILPARLDNRRADNDGKGEEEEHARWRAADLDPLAEATVRSLEIAYRGDTLWLNLQSMGAAMREMRKCTADLVASWGLNADVQENLASHPWPITAPNTWIRSAEYPLWEGRQGEQALIHFRLMVDANGVPTTCAIQNATGSVAFSAATCELLTKRARFLPARAKDGTTVPSYFVSTVRWLVLR